MITGLATILSEVADMTGQLAFYRDVLGLKPGFTSPGWSTVHVGANEIAMHPPYSRGESSGWIVGVETDDIKALKTTLESAGAVVGDFHEVPNGVILEFRDPAGNRLQAIQHGVKEADVRG